MEISLHSLSLAALPTSGRPSAEKSCFLSGLPLSIPRSKRHPNARNLKFLDFTARTIGYTQGTNESNPRTKNVIRQEMQQKDDDLAFVAGATGRVGSRTVRELLKLGFRVRAGVRITQKAQALVESVQQLKLDDTAVKKLEIVECDLEKDAIGPAIGNASVVICCIGASEKEVFDITGPYRIDYLATKKLIDAATAVKVKHFILLTSLGTNKVGFPAAILNLFWGVLIWKRKAEEALLGSGLPYTIVRPGGMERPTDDYKLTHNLVLANEDIYFGGQVSNLHVAELMAFMSKSRSLSFCKVVEVIAETTAPPTPMGELLAKIPSQREDTYLVKELKDDPKPDPTPSRSIEAATPGTRKEVPQVDVPKPRPGSPYVAYEDLKPPTSPTPTPSSSSGVKASILPPLPPNGGDGAAGSSKEPSPQEGHRAPSIETEVQRVSSQNSIYLSPYYMYDDMKPPASPSPSALNEDLKTHRIKEPLVVNACLPHVPPSDKPVDSEHLNQQKARLPSPFTLYEDLKPPTSPTPSPPK